MGLIDDATAAQLRDAFTHHLADPVHLVVFSPALHEPVSEEVRELVEEVAALAPDKITVEARRLALDEERAAALGVERVPAIAPLGAAKDHGIRFYGLPSGYEFGSLVDLILDVSSGRSGLADATRQALASLEEDVHVRVFSTPT